MTFAVDDGCTGVGDGAILEVHGIHGNPEGPALEVLAEQLERRRLGGRDAGQTDLDEDLSGVDLDVLQLR
jgi:hypothetical protein